jgi:hypothetical protein
MKFSGRFKSRLEANVGIGGCVSGFEPVAHSAPAELGERWMVGFGRASPMDQAAATTRRSKKNQ